MQIVFVIGHRYICVRQWGVNNQVMVACVFGLNTCWRNTSTG